MGPSRIGLGGGGWRIGNGGVHHSYGGSKDTQIAQCPNFVQVTVTAPQQP